MLHFFFFFLNFRITEYSPNSITFHHAHSLKLPEVKDRKQ